MPSDAEAPKVHVAEGSDVAPKVTSQSQGRSDSPVQFSNLARCARFPVGGQNEVWLPSC